MLSTGRQGHRGGGDRGSRGGRGGGNIYRGPSSRGRGTGFNASNQTSTTRDGHQDFPRGGAALRGGAKMRGDRPGARNNFRGRGSSQTKSTSTTPEPSFVSSKTTNSTPFEPQEYAKRLQYLRDNRPQVRAQLVKQRLMNPDGPMHISDRVEPYGICTDMCPEYERVRRIVENDYKAAECTPETAHGPRPNRVPDESRMVKAFTRSAAGAEEELVSEKRTPDTCLKTLDYMWQRLDEEEMDFLYQWLWDRTRSVRRDLVGKVRTKDITAYLTVVEQCVRFHLLSCHQMAGSESSNYDHATDHGNDIEQLRNCYLSLRHRYEDNKAAKIDNMNQAEFVAYDIILTLALPVPMIEDSITSLEENYRHNRRVQTAIELKNCGNVALSKHKETFQAKQQNWRRFWRLLESPNVSYLMACAAELSFNKIRHHILDTLRIAYRPRKTRKPAPTDDWSLEKLTDVLGFDTQEQTKDFCQSYGFEFVRNNESVEFLDANSIPQNGDLIAPPEGRKQFFSHKYVESKRHRREYSAIMKGMSVHEAKVKNLVGSELNVGVDVLKEQDDEDSLFIPDDSTAKANGTASTPGFPGQLTNGIAKSSLNQALNPFASAFQPSSGSPFQGTQNPADAKRNPFASAGPAVSSSAANPATIQSGLFDASKNTIQFAPTTDANGSSLLASKSGNPFAKAAPATPAAFNPFGTAATSGVTPAATNPFVAASTPAISPEPPATQTNTSWSFTNLSATHDRAKESPAQGKELFQGFPSASSQPTPISTATFQLPPQPTASTQADDQQHAEEQRRIANEQRRAQEEQEQQAEQQRRIQEQNEGERRIREEEERRVQAARERQAQEERLRRDQEEAERRAREERSQAYNSLAETLLMDQTDGLMSQFLEHIATGMAKEIAEELQEQRAEHMAEEMYAQKRMVFTRAVCVRWVQQVEKKKKKAEARLRRQQLRAFRAEAEAARGKPALEADSATHDHNIAAPSGAPNGFKKPEAPASVRHQKELSKPQKRINSAKNSGSIPKKDSSSNKSTRRDQVVPVSTQASDLDLGSTNRDYSDAYYKSKAPIDRTETDWFKLRAMGIDPSKHRKRSFGSVSSDGDEEPETESKRARRSTSSSFRRSLPPPATDEERLARFRKVQEAFNKGGATPRSHEGIRSVNGNTNGIIAQARELLTNTPTPEHSLPKPSPPNTQHEFSRSVPGSGFSKPAPQLSMFGRSIGASQPHERPAYRNRSSRFVPQHLYGKGAEAVMAYRNRLYGRPPVKTEPLQLSSPIPTQQSSVATTDAQQEYDDTLSQFAEDEAYTNEPMEDLLDYSEEEDEEIEQEEEGSFEEEEEEEDYESDGDSQMSESGSQGYTEKPGGTQDDAIELSD